MPVHSIEQLDGRTSYSPLAASWILLTPQPWRQWQCLLQVKAPQQAEASDEAVVQSEESPEDKAADAALGIKEDLRPAALIRKVATTCLMSLISCVPASSCLASASVGK